MNRRTGIRRAGGAPRYGRNGGRAGRAPARRRPRRADYGAPGGRIRSGPGRPDRRWLLALPVAVLLAAGLTALVRAGAGPGQPDPGPPAGGASADDVLVLVTGTSTEKRPALPDAGRLLLQERAMADFPGDRGPHATVLGVDGDGATAGETVDLTPRRGTGPRADVEHMRDRRKVAVDAKLAEVAAAVGAVRASMPGHALLAGLQAAGRRPERTVVVCSSGLDTVPPFDLRQTGFDYGPDRLVGYLRKIDALPRLTGKRVLLALADPAGRQSRLPEQIRRALEELWSAIITAAGGDVVPVASASTERPLTAVGSPIVPVPAPPPPPPPPPPGPQPGPDVVRELPAALLFHPDSAELLDPAGAQREIAKLARGVVGRSTVTIVGHTAYAHDGPDEGRPLSLRRARVVAQLFRRAGVPARAITSAGVGFRDPPHPPASDPRNRVVVITIRYRR